MILALKNLGTYIKMIPYIITAAAVIYLGIINIGLRTQLEIKSTQIETLKTKNFSLEALVNQKEEECKVRIFEVINDIDFNQTTEEIDNILREEEQEDQNYDEIPDEIPDEHSNQKAKPQSGMKPGVYTI